MSKTLSKLFLIASLLCSLPALSSISDSDYFKSLEFGSASEYSNKSSDFLILKSCSDISYGAASLDAQSSLSHFIESVSSNSVDYELSDDVISNSTTVFLNQSDSNILSNFIELNRYKDSGEFCLTTGIPLTLNTNPHSSSPSNAVILSDLDTFLSEEGILPPTLAKVSNTKDYVYKTTIGQFSTIANHSVLPRDGAIKNALNNAVAEVFGISIKSQSLMSSLETTIGRDSVSNDVFSFMSSSDLAGKIDSYEVLTEHESDNIYTVKIKSKITLPSSDKPTIKKIIEKLSNPKLFIDPNNILRDRLKPILIKYGFNLTNDKAKSLLTLKITPNSAFSSNSNNNQISFIISLFETSNPNQILASWKNDPTIFPIYKSNDVDKIYHAYLLRAESSGHLKSLFTKGLLNILSVGGFNMNAIIERGGIGNIDMFTSALNKSDKFVFKSIDILPYGYLVNFHSKNSPIHSAKSIGHYVSLFTTNSALDIKVLSPMRFQYSNKGYNISPGSKMEFIINISDKYSFNKSLFLSLLLSSDEFLNINTLDKKYGTHISFDFYNDPSEVKNIYHEAIKKSVHLDSNQAQKLIPYQYFKSEYRFSVIDYNPLGGEIYKTPSLSRTAIDIFHSVVNYLILFIDYLSTILDGIIGSIKNAMK